VTKEHRLPYPDLLEGHFPSVKNTTGNVLRHSSDILGIIFIINTSLYKTVYTFTSRWTIAQS